MKNIVIACSILLTIPLDAMKRLRDNKKQENRAKKICLAHMIKLPLEIERLITDIAINTSHALKPCIHIIKSLALTNKHNYQLFNNQNQSDEWIEHLSKKFRCSDEIVAQNFHTPHANNRLSLQRELLSLCSHNNFEHNATQRFNQLIEKGVKVDFTYNYNNQPQTLLMIHHDKLSNMAYEKKHSSIFYQLTQKANFNQQTSHNKTLLIKVVTYPISYFCAKTIIKHEKVTINKQNNRGETALLYCIKNRKPYQITQVFFWTIKKLLKKGANPLLADRNGYTPLDALYDIADLSEMKDILIQQLKDSVEKHLSSHPTNSQ